MFPKTLFIIKCNRLVFMTSNMVDFVIPAINNYYCYYTKYLPEYCNSNHHFAILQFMTQIGGFQVAIFQVVLVTISDDVANRPQKGTVVKIRTVIGPVVTKDTLRSCIFAKYVFELQMVFIEEVSKSIFKYVSQSELHSSLFKSII